MVGDTKARPGCAVDAGVGHPASSPSLPDDACVVGRLVANRYLIEETCERTRETAIYRARHLLTGRAVLLRVLGECTAITHGHCRDALAHAERAGALPSPHVARTLDVGVVAERWPFVVSEYTRGQTLAAVLAQQGPLGLRRVLTIARALGSVLSMAHVAGLMHGELLPSGVWVESPGGRPEWVRLLDFGVRALREPTPEASRSGVYRSSSLTDAGAPLSLAAVRSDVQALGSVLHELLLGARVGSGMSLAGVLDSALSGSAWGGERALVRSFAKLVERCLCLAPESAHRSMGEVCRDLDILAQTAAALDLTPPGQRPPVTAIHAPARRACVALGGPKVIVRGG
jgi:eukaryotic-like serine/threonine-protein kinase